MIAEVGLPKARDFIHHFSISVGSKAEIAVKSSCTRKILKLSLAEDDWKITIEKSAKPRAAQIDTLDLQFPPGRLLLQQLAVISHTPNRRHASRNFPRSAMMVPFA